MFSLNPLCSHETKYKTDLSVFKPDFSTTDLPMVLFFYLIHYLQSQMRFSFLPIDIHCKPVA